VCEAVEPFVPERLENERHLLRFVPLLNRTAPVLSASVEVQAWSEFPLHFHTIMGVPFVTLPAATPMQKPVARFRQTTGPSAFAGEVMAWQTITTAKPNSA
jgi:hypothetical protein